MNRINQGRMVLLITTIFIFTQAAILLISEYFLFNYGALSADAISTKNALIILMMFASAMLWAQCIGIMLILYKKGIDAKTIDVCGSTQMCVWITVAILFATLRVLFLRYYSINVISIINSAS